MDPVIERRVTPLTVHELQALLKAANVILRSASTSDNRQQSVATAIRTAESMIRS